MQTQVLNDSLKQNNSISFLKGILELNEVGFYKNKRQLFNVDGASLQEYKKGKPCFLKSWKKIADVHGKSEWYREEFKKALLTEKLKDDQSSKTDTDTEDDMLKKIGQRPDRKPKKEQFERLPDGTGGDIQAQAEM